MALRARDVGLGEAVARCPLCGLLFQVSVRSEILQPADPPVGQACRVILTPTPAVHVCLETRFLPIPQGAG